MIEFPKNTYSTINDLMMLELSTNYGTMITVGDVADVVYSDVPETLVRSDGKYQVSITAYTTEASKFTAQNEINKAVLSAIENG